MTTVTDTRPAAATPTVPRPVYKVTGRGTLRSEWSKFWSVRSTWITVALALIALVGFGTIAAFRYKSMMSGGARHVDRDFLDATSVSLTLFGVNFGQLALGVLGVLFAAGEYTTGSIRSTLTAVPKRLPVLWSKVAVYGVVAFVIGTVGSFAGFLVTNAIVSGTAAHLSLTGDVARSLFGAGLYLGLIGVLAAALGAILRSVAGGISAFIAVIMLIPGLLSLLPTSWQGHVGPYLPSSAGEAIYTLHQQSDLLTPGKGALVLLGWTVLAVAGAAWRLVGRDA
ncbi:ABC-2 transporter permease [Hamadaea tsunoensis]|uniref:ABC transporter permease n=1 Tax=Hamadaea tsunoensis TaxID=53368 RepID=UPI0003F80CF4|nr:ABC transporter permease [Hamadaea tsunoensis]